MDAQLNAFLEDNSARLVAAKNEGQRVIRDRWGMLAEETRTTLVDSGFYSPRGELRVVEGPATDLLQHDVGRLEQLVGVFRLCLDAKLPLTTEKGLAIPYEAQTDEVMNSVRALLFVRNWQDPFFLRLALGAVSKHQQAEALNMHTPKSTFAPAWGCLGALFKVALLLAMPVGLAAGIAAATRQDVGGAALSFYIVSFGVLAAMSAYGVGAKKREWFEVALDRWTRFEVNGAVGVTGAGALEHLRRMAQDGVSVPSIAFDVAESLRCRTTAAGLPGPTKRTTEEA